MIVHFDIEQGSPEWERLRAGKPTASEFHRVVTSKGERSKSLEDYAAQLAAESFAKRPLDRWEGNGSTERGHALEDEARRAYGFLRGVETIRVGFVDAGAVGASPDALIEANGLLELKCQQAKGHVQTLDYFARHGRPPPDYIAQAQGQMLVCERAWVDLMFYHPDLPELIIRIDRDTAFFEKLAANLEETLKERERLLSIIRGYV